MELNWDFEKVNGYILKELLHVLPKSMNSFQQLYKLFIYTKAKWTRFVSQNNNRSDFCFLSMLSSTIRNNANDYVLCQVYTEESREVVLITCYVFIMNLHSEANFLPLVQEINEIGIGVNNVLAYFTLSIFQTSHPTRNVSTSPQSKICQQFPIFLYTIYT